MSYNGHANYETWVIALWIDNDQGINESVKRIARDNHYNDESTIAKEIEDLFRNTPYDGGFYPESIETGPFADLLNASLGEVDWYEIASAWIEEEDDSEEDLESEREEE